TSLAVGWAMPTALHSIHPLGVIMFDRRLRILLAVFIAAGLVLAIRLGQLQIADRDYYRAQAEQSVILKPTQLPFVRGSIRDRSGEIFVIDEPCWDLTLDFGIIAAG